MLDMRDSGDFILFHFVLSFSVALFLANIVSIRDPTVRLFFNITLIIHIVYFLFTL